LRIEYCLLVIESALRKFIRRHSRAFFNNQPSFFNSQFSIHLKEALAQRTFTIPAKLDLITTSFAGQELQGLGAATWGSFGAHALGPIVQGLALADVADAGLAGGLEEALEQVGTGLALGVVGGQ